ncbi:hypothetical protein [Nostoc sphaeroides]|uniref:Uncharacterized protein n=1 Tax=Nostoc sphaeroides CCNUC1 TaxID=2653204 RepID=A0A5P8VZA3_9NOSO|nr:hypothetical protein [Nostoc sphaeroides]QFS45773.1 hypothetical protein GXM_03250 [Nostoc sphaeroides CCNUC1]
MSVTEDICLYQISEARKILQEELTRSVSTDQLKAVGMGFID